jgi:hypothetical protein
MIRNEPPPTADAIAEHVADYMVALEEIEETRADNPLLAAEKTIRTNICLIAGLSPAGSPGPADTHLALLEAVQEMRRGLRPSLMRHAPLPDPEITVDDIARRLGVASSTLYRHLPKARSAVLDSDK